MIVLIVMEILSGATIILTVIIIICISTNATKGLCSIIGYSIYCLSELLLIPLTSIVLTQGHFYLYSTAMTHIMNI